jgi:NADH-quinone oxidoreductase subunit L
MYLLIPFFPLVSALLAGFGGRLIGAKNAAYATTILVALTFCTSFACFLNVGLNGESVAIKLGDWFTCGLLELHWGFLFDPLSVSVICVVSGVSSLVHLYSIG